MTSRKRTTRRQMVLAVLAAYAFGILVEKMVERMFG